MENQRYDHHYPLSHDDALRVCAWVDDEWKLAPGATKLTVTHRECNRRFHQWNRQQNYDPWALCPKHADESRRRSRRQRK